MVNVWDLRTDEGSLTMTYPILCPPDIPNIAVNTPIKILDASFSVDGRRLIVTDHIGRLLFFSLVSSTGSSAARIPSEQYFSTDYSDFYTDERGLAYDTGTNTPVHLTPGSYLCRMDGSSYGETSHDKLTHAQLSITEVSRSLKEKRRQAQEALSKLDASFRSFRRYKNKQTMLVSLPQPKLLSTTHNQRSKVVSLSSSSSSSCRRYIAPEPVDYRDYISEAEDDRDLDYGSESNSSEEEEEEVQAASRRSLRAQQRAIQLEDIRITSRHSRRSRRERARKTVTIIADSDEEGEEGTDQRVYEGESSSNDEEVRIPREHKRESRRNAVTARVSRASSSSERRVPPPRQSATSRRIWRAGGNQCVPIDVEIQRDWASSAAPVEYEYCPQMGDLVVYFPQGHVEHLTHFPETSQPVN